MRQYAGTARNDPDAITKIDYFLRDVSAGMARINKGQVPSGSGTTIAGVTRHPDLLDLNFSDDHAHHPWMLGRAATQAWYGLSTTNPNIVGGITLHSNNSADTAHARIELDRTILNFYGDFKIFDQQLGGAAVSFALGNGFTNCTWIGTLEVRNSSLVNPNITVRNDQTGASAAATLINVIGRAGQTAVMYESKIGVASTGHHMDFYNSANPGVLASYISADGVWTGAVSGALTPTGTTNFTGGDVYIGATGAHRGLNIWTTDSSTSSPSRSDGLNLIDQATGFNLTLVTSPSMTADALVNFPLDGGALLSDTSTAIVTSKTLAIGVNVNNFIECQGANGGTVFTKGATVTNAGFRISNSAIAAATIQTISTQNLTGTLVMVGDDPPAVAAGALGKVDLTAQAADITTTNLSNTPPAGLYRVDVYLITTATDAGASTLTVTIGWTDTLGATTDTSMTRVLTATGRTVGSVLCQVASGNITYAVTGGGTYGTARFAVYVRVTALG